jgi:hypothetical protein
MSDLPPGLQRVIRDQIKALWTARWPAPPGVPVIWRENFGEAAADPGDAPHYLDMEVDFGVERRAAFGAGRGKNERLKFGSVVIRVMASTGTGDDRALDLLGAAEDVFRSQRIGALSFIGDVSGFDTKASGNWSMRASQAAWEYRFRG